MPYADPRKRWESQRRYCLRIGAELRATLGDRCACCGTTEDLEFDHIDPARIDGSTKSWTARMAEYVRAWKSGNLQLLCKLCNGHKSDGVRCTAKHTSA